VRSCSENTHYAYGGGLDPCVSLWLEPTNRRWFAAGCATVVRRESVLSRYASRKHVLAAIRDAINHSKHLLYTALQCKKC